MPPLKSPAMPQRNVYGKCKAICRFLSENLKGFSKRRLVLHLIFSDASVNLTPALHSSTTGTSENYPTLLSKTAFQIKATISGRLKNLRTSRQKNTSILELNYNLRFFDLN